jgi:hypothetical protein
MVLDNYYCSPDTLGIRVSYPLFGLGDKYFTNSCLGSGNYLALAAGDNQKVKESNCIN